MENIDDTIIVLETDTTKEFEVPIIEVKDRNGSIMKVAPASILPKLKKDDEFTREGEMVDEEIFYYADKFGKTEDMLNEIKESTGIKVGLVWASLDGNGE